jgi:uncharacterized protein YjbI with pentapeptide repeats
MFEQPVTVQDAKFERTVDLSDSKFKRGADFRGVEFDAPALLRHATFVAGANFSLSVFQDLSSFSEARFQASATFDDARFEDAEFIATRFSAATYEGATFRGAARFHRAVFADAATFRDDDFRQRSDFSLTRFEGGATFTGAQLGDDASFLGAHFVAAGDSAEAATFQDVSAARNLNFTFAHFDTAGKPNKDRSDYVAVFANLVCGRSLTFEDATFAPGPLNMQQLQAQDLALDVHVTSSIDGKQWRRSMLRLIESSAKARGDLVTANNAHYALHVDESKDYALIPHTLDFVFYRGIAGYFVRPFRPLLILLAIVALLSLLSVLATTGKATVTAHSAAALGRGRRLWTRSSSSCGNFVTCFLDKLGLIRPQRSNDSKPPPLRRRLESFVYRLLVVCAVLGLANSNPTLRQMVESLL